MLKSIIQDENGNYIYQSIKLNYFQRAKDLIQNNVVQYVQSIISCVEERFGKLGEENLDDDVVFDERIIDGDRVLHGIYKVLDSRN